MLLHLAWLLSWTIRCHLPPPLQIDIRSAWVAVSRSAVDIVWYLEFKFYSICSEANEQLPLNYGSKYVMGLYVILPNGMFWPHGLVLGS